MGISEEEGLKILYNFYNQIGRIPKDKDFKEYNIHPQLDWYTIKFGSYKKACEEADIIKITENDKNTQEVVNEIIKNNKNIQFKICNKCKRKLPAHEWFYNKHPKGLLGFDTRCKECENKIYKFINNIKPWYGNKEEFIKNYRKMSISQLKKIYKDNEGRIENFIRKLGLKNEIIIETLTEEEVLFMYNSLLNGEIKAFTNGLFKCKNRIKYANIIIRYLFNDILKWTRENICNEYGSDILKQYKLSGLLVCLKITYFEIINNAFPEYNLFPWNLKKSSVGNGYWKDEIHVKNASQWFRDKLLKDKNIKNINEAGVYGFNNLIQEYNMAGLCLVKFKSNRVLFFKYIYNVKFNKQEMLKINFTFNINNEKNNQILEGKIYKITEQYNNLDDRGKTLINEIIRFCEENNRFPSEKDITNKNGYISRSQYYKYFNCETFTSIYKYIQPIIEEKPKIYCCNKCHKEKPFINQYFREDIHSKFGLKKICKECEVRTRIQIQFNELCKKYNIKEEDKFNSIIWFEKSFEVKMKQLPKFCYTEENIIKIIRYVMFNKVCILNKNDLLEKFNSNILRQYKLEALIYLIGNKSECLRKCFPEYTITDEDFIFNKYTDEYMNNIIKNIIDKYNLNIMDILNNNFSSNLMDFREIKTMLSYKFYKKGLDMIDMFLWYFEKNKILHPIYNRKIIRYDFKNIQNGFYNIKSNRITKIKMYCEEECKENILTVINNTESLKEWTFKYFKSDNISSIIYNYNKYGSLYELLVETYPQIKNNYILFDWEWHQFNKSDKNTLIREIREFIIYRMNDVIINYEQDIPKYININNIDNIYPKLNKQIDKHRFNSYYEWCCLAFPEYKNKWTKEDFGMIVSYDGNEFNSYQEKNLYENIKKDNIFEYIKPIGKKRSGKYIFQLNEDYEYNKFCPDFVIEYLNINNKKYKLSKPLIIEFYGMYEPNNKYYIYQNYVKKTKIKEQFYKSKDDIYYIGVFPEDIKNNYKKFKEKLGFFIMQNFDIDISNNIINKQLTTNIEINNLDNNKVDIVI